MYAILTRSTGTVHVEFVDGELYCDTKVTNGMRFASLPTLTDARNALIRAPKPCGKCARAIGLVTPVRLNAPVTA